MAPQLDKDAILQALGVAGFPSEAAASVNDAEALDDKAQKLGIQTKTAMSGEKPKDEGKKPEPTVAEQVAEALKSVDFKTIFAEAVNEAIDAKLKPLAESVTAAQAKADEAEAAAKRASEGLTEVKALAAGDKKVDGKKEADPTEEQEKQLQDTAKKVSGAAEKVSAFGTAVYTRG